MGYWDWKTYFIFIIVLLLSLPWLIRYERCKKNSGIHYLILALLPGFLLLAMRGRSVGIDLVRYERAIQYINNFDIKINELFSEPLMSLVYWISYKLGGLHAFIVITSGLEFIFVGIALNILHKSGKKVILLYYFYFGFVIIRSFSMVSNAIAIAISLCAYIYLPDCSESSNKKYWFYSILAFLFHNSAVINIVVFFCCRSTQQGSVRKKQKLIFFRICILICFIIGIYILSKGVFNTLISSLANSEYERLQVENNFGIGNTLVRLPFLFLVIFSLPQIHRKIDYEIDSYVWLLVVDLIVAQMKYMNQDFERFTMYTGLTVVFLCPYLYGVYKNRWNGIIKLVAPCIVVIYITYYLYFWAIQSSYGIMPYQIWR